MSNYHLSRFPRAAFAAFAVVAAVGSAAAQSRPATYAEFNTSVKPDDGNALKAAITNGSVSAIYLQPGIYELWNPVVIDRSTPLFLHGADRRGTRLVARDPTKPLFQVKRAPLVNFAAVDFFPIRNYLNTVNSIAIETINTDPVSLEFQDCFVESSTLRFAGPGTYRVQNCAITPGGMTHSGVQIDHPGADVMIFGGDITNGLSPLQTNVYAAHVWQKRGRLRIYATSVEATLGEADIRIETASAFGPHVIASVRSEGANGVNNKQAVSRLLYVPPTSEAVDVVVKSSGGAWLTGPDSPDPSVRINCKLVWYNGAGTLWLFGNRGEVCIRHLVEGNAPQAQIVSVGNNIASPQPFAVAPQRLVTVLDGFSNFFWSGSEEFPWSRWIPDGSTPPRLDPALSVPLPPQDVLPPSLGRPTVTAALPGMIDVKAPAFGARGDGITDDTAAIQRALDANCDSATPKVIYFPAGTYRITNTLYLNHHSGGTCHGKLAIGGWIAGAGSGRTVIQMTPGMQKGVFATDGFALATVQGITFKTWAWQAGGAKEPNVDFELYPGYVPTQQNSLYDVVFDGGFLGFANGVRTPTGGQCSSMAVFQAQFRNTSIGFVSGHYNAIANVVYDASFINNDYAIGAWTEDEVNMPPGGSFAAFRVTSRGTRKKDILIRGSATGTTTYLYKWDSDADAYVTEIGPTAAANPILLDRARIAPRTLGSAIFDIATAAGPIFLRSTVVGGVIRTGGSGSGQGYAISVASDISGWAQTVVRTNGAIEQIAIPAAASLGAPGQPVVSY